MRTTDRVHRSSHMGRAVFGCAVLLMLAGPSAAQTHYGFDRPATPAEINGWNIDVEPDGSNLPAGSGSIAHGRDVYKLQCAACHGASGEGGIGDRLVGGTDTLATSKPVKTVGSYWPYATTLFDYIRRAMPLNAPQSLSTEDVYAVSGYVLFLNGLLAETAVVDAATLTSLKMPNRGGFVDDPRPDVKATDCMANCVK